MFMGVFIMGLRFVLSACYILIFAFFLSWLTGMDAIKIIELICAVIFIILAFDSAAHSS